MYESAVASFENFRLYICIIIFRIFGQYRYQTVNFIAYLEKMNYKASTAKSYISGFKMKVMAIQDTTKSFVITKMLCGMERKHKRINARKTITFEIWEKNINVLLHVCNSYYEATLFAGCFSVAFFWFFEGR